MRLFSILLIFIVVSCQNEKTANNIFVKYHYDGNIKIEASINDSIKGLFIFDTGADGLYLDSSFVSENKSIVKSTDTAIIGGAGNSGNIKIIIINNSLSVSIGKQKMSFDTIPILKLERINNQKIAGIIGNDFIKKGVLFINNNDTTLAIDTVVDSKKYQTGIPLEFSKGRFYLKVRIILSNGKTLEPRLKLDLGCTDAIILNTPYFNKIKSNIPTFVDYAILDGGVSGNTEGGEFRAQQLKLGIKSVDLPIISFSKDTAGALASLKSDGLLGNGLLDRYNYAIDYKHNVLYLNSIGKINKPYKSTVSGLYVVRQNDIAIVKCIYEQFEPFKQGVNIGDTIIKINNKDVSGLTQKQIDDILNTENKSIEIVTKHEDKLKTIKYKTEKKI